MCKNRKKFAFKCGWQVFFDGKRFSELCEPKIDRREREE
jgi:hypothetical protein